MSQHLDAGPAPPHMLISLDSMSTSNQVGEEDLEKECTPYMGLNTGAALVSNLYISGY